MIPECSTSYKWNPLWSQQKHRVEFLIRSKGSGNLLVGLIYHSLPVKRGFSHILPNHNLHGKISNNSPNLMIQVCIKTSEPAGCNSTQTYQKKREDSELLWFQPFFVWAGHVPLHCKSHPSSYLQTIWSWANKPPISFRSSTDCRFLLLKTNKFFLLRLRILLEDSFMYTGDPVFCLRILFSTAPALTKKISQAIHTERKRNNTQWFLPVPVKGGR